MASSLRALLGAAPHGSPGREEPEASSDSGIWWFLQHCRVLSIRDRFTGSGHRGKVIHGHCVVSVSERC